MDGVQNRQKMSGFLDGVRISEFRETTERDFLTKSYYNTVHFLLIKSGTIKCTIHKAEYDCKGGDVFVSNLFESYAVQILSPVSGFSVVIEQDYLLGITSGEKYFNNKLRLPSGTMKKILSMLNRAADELAHNNTYEKRGFVNYFIGAFDAGELFADTGKKRADDLFDRVRQYIDEHFNEELNLSFLSKKFGYSSKYFSSAFNKYFGVNLNSYLNYVRVKKSIEIEKRLRGSHTISEIIFTSGFTSRETYYRALRKYKKEADKITAILEGNGQWNFRKCTAVIVGYGNRGQVYADYSLERPDELAIAAVVEPNEYKRNRAKARYSLTDDRLFADMDSFLQAKIQCDIAINATMDQKHYETAMQLLEAGYNMLIEEPIVPTAEELFSIRNKAEEKGCKVFVCHVLRYTPYYKAIKKLINDGEIGRIMTVEMNENVCASHYVTSFDRGKWNSEEACGLGLLLAKSCHDMDLMCWLNNVTVPIKVASLGSRAQFIKENMPEGASEFCYDCKYERTCQYSAIRQYLDRRVMPFLVWDKLDKPLEEITEEEKIEFLRKDNYGRCAYIAGGDLVDRQGVIVTFENGSCGTFMLVGGATKAERGIRIIGTDGEIEGKFSEDKFTLRKYSKDAFDGIVKTIDLKEDISLRAKRDGHSGGDFAIMHDLIVYLNGVEDSASITALSDSIYGHLCVFAAEKARKESLVVSLPVLQ